MIYIENTTVRTAKSEIYLGNMGCRFLGRETYQCIGEKEFFRLVVFLEVFFRSGQSFDTLSNHAVYTDLKAPIELCMIL